MNITKHLPKEIAKYFPSVVPLAALPFFPDMPPEVLAIFGVSIQNCIDIIYKALPFLDDGADLGEINLDWRANLFDKCRLVSDDEMQTWWAQILAGEANNRGTYSKRSVNSFADMDKKDAELFTELCRYVCEFKFTTGNVEEIEYIPLIFDEHLSPLRPGYSNIEFTYDIHTRDLEHLENIGLIRFAGPQGTDLGEDADRIYSDGPIEASYYGECIRLHTVHGSRIGPPIGRVRLTQTGKELYPICRNIPEGSLPVDGIFGLDEWGGFMSKS